MLTCHRGGAAVTECMVAVGIGVCRGEEGGKEEWEDAVGAALTITLRRFHKISQNTLRCIQSYYRDNDGAHTNPFHCWLSREIFMNPLTRPMSPTPSFLTMLLISFVGKRCHLRQ